MQGKPDNPKFTMTLTKSDALAYAAALLRREISSMELVASIAEAVEQSQTPPPADVVASIKEIRRDVPEIRLQIKARESAAAFIEDLVNEERLIAARMANQQS